MGAVGHVFQGRFKAIVVDRDSYLLELCRYVVLNPIRAGMVEQIECYTWSSYLATTGLAGRPAWLETDWVLGQFAKTRAAARRRYTEFVAEGEGLPSPWSAVRGHALLGPETFVEKMRPFLEGLLRLEGNSAHSAFAAPAKPGKYVYKRGSRR